MATNYQAYEFKVTLGYPGGTCLSVRVHAPDRMQAWARVQQMHPRAVEARARAKVSAERELVHTAESDR